MKQVFLMLVFWASMVHGVFAGYDINVTGSNCNFTCTIAPDNTTTWTIGDLITWIFPDGQYKQSTIVNNNGTLEGNSTNWVPWKPDTYWGNNKKVVGIVTKKGGTGNPSIVYQDEGPITLSCSSFSTQSAVTFPNNSLWTIKPLWSFAPDASNYFLVTYKDSPGCEISLGYRINIFLPPNVTYLGAIAFNGEKVDPLSSSTIGIKDLQQGQGYRNIIIKLGTNNNVNQGGSLQFDFFSLLCERKDTTIFYEVKQHPHDPNSKRVNIKNICPNKRTPTLLHYKVQFHNDGKAPVKKVTVIDTFGQALNPATFIMTHAPNINGITSSYTHSITNNILKLEFNGPGLPGLGQTNQNYLYHETVYQFEFDIETNPVVKKDFSNAVKIIFYKDVKNSNTQQVDYLPLDPVYTELEWVRIGCRKKPKFCDCLRLLLRRKR